MTTLLIPTVIVTVFAFVAVLAKSQPASAHCDTEDGPAVTDGRRALATGNINHALKWINTGGEDELREAFDQALAARRTATDSAATADQAFLESLVRIHRAGEGAGFDGIQPAGTALDPIGTAADTALASGSLDELTELVPAERIPHLRALFAQALARKDFDVDDVNAGRDYIAAYVAFFKFAEGEEHHHTDDHRDHDCDHVV